MVITTELLTGDEPASPLAQTLRDHRAHPNARKATGTNIAVQPPQTDVTLRTFRWSVKLGRKVELISVAMYAYILDAPHNHPPPPILPNRDKQQQPHTPMCGTRSGTIITKRPMYVRHHQSRAALRPSGMSHSQKLNNNRNTSKTSAPLVPTALAVPKPKVRPLSADRLNVKTARATATHAKRTHYLDT